MDNFTIPSILKACSRISSTRLGKEIHGFAMKSRLDSDVFVNNALIQMYSECKCLEEARQLFDKMEERDVVSWSTMVRCYGKNRLFGEALELIGEMHLMEVKPSEVAMISMVNLFSDLKNPTMAKPMHAYVLRNNSKVEQMGTPISTSLIDMYAKCGNLGYARSIFDGFSNRTIVSWTAMIAGYIRGREFEEGAKLFVEMMEENMLPNDVSILSMIIECGFARALELGRCVHGYILRNGFALSLALATALIDMYGKCGKTRYARALFDIMEKRDVMTWTAMISSYSEANCIDEAFDIFTRMTNTGIRPNQVTVVSLLSLCAEVGALNLGKWVHAYMEKQGVESDIILKTALIDMYAKCGEIDRAHRLFTEALHRDICLCNAMINGLAMHGYANEAFSLFSEMETMGLKPNDITFIGILHACSHSGMVNEGKRIFERMGRDFKLVPKVEHYGCMVDLLGRAGRLDECHEFIKNMPIKPNMVIWGALLAACKLHKNPKLGEIAAIRVFDIEPQNCGYNVLLSNIYATDNRWNDVAGVRKAMKDMGLTKEPGLSSMEVNGSVHEFIMGDKSHPQTEEINKMLSEMIEKLREFGYTPDTSVVMLNIDEEEKESVVNYHSEKLALAYGFISTVPRTPIRIVKNLRICDDCHSAIKLLSKIYDRVITIRDRKRFHHFKEGTCSCADYW